MGLATDLKPGQDILGLLLTAGIPEIRWVHGDDLCDCTFQRIGEWTNPYLARTLRVRVCCIWAELYKQYPQYVQEIPAWWDENNKAMVNEPQEWNSEDEDMPIHIWYRQIAVQRSITVAAARKLAKSKGWKPPKAVQVGTGISTRNLPLSAAIRNLPVT